MRRSFTILMIAALLQGCAAEPVAPEVPAPGPAGPSLVVVDVDAFGAIVIDRSKRSAFGVRRDGGVAWREPLGPRSAAPVACLARCPDAVLSGRAGSTSSASTPEPEPAMIVAGRRQPLDAIDDVRRRVLAAGTPDDLVVAGGDGDGNTWLEFRRGKNVDRVAVRGIHVSWNESADGAWALAIATDAAGSAEARWFARRAGPCHPFGQSIPVAAVDSCIDPAGRFALLLGQRPALLERAGGQRYVTNLQHASTCALATTGGIVAEMSVSLAGEQARLCIVDSATSIVFSRDLSGAVTVSADPTSARVGYVAGSTFRQMDTRSGDQLPAIENVQAARYDGAGSLVVVNSNGAVEWLQVRH
jgi:hypothetical protein